MKKDSLLESFKSFETVTTAQKKAIYGGHTGECSTLIQTYVPTRDHYDDCDVDNMK